MSFQRSFTNTYERERAIHFIMYCLLNGVFDVNSPGITEHLKGNDRPVRYMRWLSDTKFETLYVHCMAHLRKLKFDETGKLKLHTHLLGVAHFKCKPEYTAKNSGMKAAPIVIKEYVDKCFGRESNVKLNDIVLNPNAVILPSDSVVCVLSRYVGNTWGINIVVKSDTDDPIWK